MDALRWAVAGLYDVLVTWYVAGITWGLLIFAAERWGRLRELTRQDVRRAAPMYRRHYGSEAVRAVGDHLLGSSFAQDGRHRQFLKRVSAELVRMAVVEDGRRSDVSASRTRPRQAR